MPDEITENNNNNAQGADGANGGGNENPMGFIPEAYRQESWASKYTNPEEFFKGVSHMAKLVGQKQVVNGIQLPSNEASEEELGAFYQAIGRPEAADKYQFADDIKFFEGVDTKAEREGFAQKAFAAGLTQKQVDVLFKEYANELNTKLQGAQKTQGMKFDQALKEAFGDDFKDGFDRAKKAAASLGLANKLDEEGLSANPIVLKIVAELGKYIGEDSFVSGKANGSSKESLITEARKLQASPEYQRGDKTTHAKVEEIYKKVYPN